MRMNVVESGNDSATLRVDHLGFRSPQIQNFLGVANPRDFVAANRYGFPKCTAICRVNLPWTIRRSALWTFVCAPAFAVHQDMTIASSIEERSAIRTPISVPIAAPSAANIGNSE